MHKLCLHGHFYRCQTLLRLTNYHRILEMQNVVSFSSISHNFQAVSKHVYRTKGRITRMDLYDPCKRHMMNTMGVHGIPVIVQMPCQIGHDAVVLMNNFQDVLIIPQDTGGVATFWYQSNVTCLGRRTFLETN